MFIFCDQDKDGGGGGGGGSRGRDGSGNSSRSRERVERAASPADHAKAVSAAVPATTAGKAKSKKGGGWLTAKDSSTKEKVSDNLWPVAMMK